MRAKFKKNQPKRLQNWIFTIFYDFIAVNKSITGAQKWKRKMLTEIFGICECLLTQNLTNQDSQFSWLFQTIWKTVRKSKNMGLKGVISAWRWFQNLLQSKLQKMDEKLKFIVFRVLSLFKVYIYTSNKDDIWQGKTISGVLLEEGKLSISK